MDQGYGWIWIRFERLKKHKSGYRQRERQKRSAACPNNDTSDNPQPKETKKTVPVLSNGIGEN